MLHSVILDQFMPDFEGWRAWADGLKYRDEVNPVDGVTYPGIYDHIPTFGTRARLSCVMGRPIELHALFLRLSLEGTPVPHQAHHDGAMGEYSMMVYMNRAPDCRGGTALLEHVSGQDPDVATWERDTNRPHMWRELALCRMVPNRAFIFRSNLWHRAEPIGGFGTDSANGRLVLTGFFS